MADEDDTLKPPGVDEKDDIFENFDDLIKDVEVLDECDGSDDESPSRSERRNSRRRSNSRERRNSSKKRRSRSRSRNRSRSNRSPGKSASKNGTKSGGAVAFLADLRKKFGEFPELLEMNRPSARRQAEREIRQESRRGRDGRYNQRFDQQQNQNYQQFLHGGMPQGWNPGMGPMPMQYDLQMIGGMPAPGYGQMMMGQQMMPGMNMMPGVNSMSMGMLGMQPQQMVPPVDHPQMNDTSNPELTMPLQISNRRSRDNLDSSRYSRSPSRSSRQKSRSRDNFSR